MEVVHLCVCTKRCWRCCALRLPLDPPPKKKNIIKMIVWSRRSSREVCGNSKWTEAQSAIRCINTRSPTDIKSTQATSSKEATAPNKKKQPTNKLKNEIRKFHTLDNNKFCVGLKSKVKNTNCRILQTANKQIVIENKVFLLKSAKWLITLTNFTNYIN